MTEFLTRPANFTIPTTPERLVGDPQATAEAIKGIRGRLRVLSEKSPVRTQQDVINLTSSGQN